MTGGAGRQPALAQEDGQSRLSLSVRRGGAPATNPQTPHVQLDQIAPAELQEELWRRMLSLPHVSGGPSEISLADTRAIHLDPRYARGGRTAFVPTGGTEFAHLHGPQDGSLHLHLPESAARLAIDRGWGEWHPAVTLGWAPPTVIMVYGPRDADELEVVFSLVSLSHRFAMGEEATLN